jgi:ectoine hydroxylase
MLTTTDNYPSRAGRPASFLPRHDPVVYGAPESKAASGLTAPQLEAYERDGFLILPDVFSQAEIDCFLRDATRLLGSEDIKRSGEVISEPGSGDVRSIFRVHAASPLFSRLVRDPRLVSIASDILDDEVYIHQSRLNYKPGFRGKEFYWHSDFETWHVEDGMPAMRALSMSITLTANTADNGPLMLIPGSHQSFAVCTGETPANHFKTSLKKQEYGVPTDESLAELAQNGGIVSAVSQPGSVIVFDCNTMHGSNSNITPHPRSNVFVVYNAISNRVGDPFCDQAPRPEYICSRETITTIQPEKTDLTGYRALLK